MFHSFKSKNERRNYGGSAFIELQYCKLKTETNLNKILAINSINDWQDDSLYVFFDDIDNFISNYNDLFQDINCYVINYYSPNRLQEILTKIENEKPSDYAVLLEWLKQGLHYKGIYILGI